MLGDPLIRLFMPSTISWRPGPSNVNKDRDKWNPVEWRACSHENLAPRKWERWPNRHTAHNAQETASPRPVKQWVAIVIACSEVHSTLFYTELLQRYLQITKWKLRTNTTNEGKIRHLPLSFSWLRFWFIFLSNASKKFSPLESAFKQAPMSPIQQCEHLN